MTETTTGPSGSPGPTGVAPLELFEATDEHDRRIARGASGVLGQLNAACLLTSADLHVARTLARAAGGIEESSVDAALVAAALATRAVRTGSVAVDLSQLDPALRTLDEPPDLPWADSADWTRQLLDSSLVRQGALVVEHGLVYLQRYHHQEVQVVHDLVTRAAQPPPVLDTERLETALARVFPQGWEEQREAARVATASWTSVITGGPGTGKTSTVAGVLALLAEQAGTDQLLRVGLAAPTGKAAARMQEAVAEALQDILARTDDPAARAAIEPLRDVTAVTLHRLLGYRPGSSTRFRHDREHHLPHDVVLIDETSMVSLTHMARLLEALRPTARLILVGDPNQLVSIDAGAVLADLVAGDVEVKAVEDSRPGSGTPAGSGTRAGAAPPRPVTVARLRTSHRFGEEIGTLAEALRVGDADAVLDALRSGHGSDGQVTWVEDPDPTAYLRPLLTRHALGVYRAAQAGQSLEALDLLAAHRLLCAHREGPWGVRTWNRAVEGWLTEETGDGLYDPMYVGRPLLVTANDYATGVFNGDTGVVVAIRREDGHSGRVAVVRGSEGDQTFGTSRLGDVETMHAMTVHKAQGSQAEEITVLLPPEESPLLTRELFYTAVTRARTRVRVVGSETAVRAAVGRRVQRASGLRQRLAEVTGR
ncbi:exodeoxyribonuclease V subunit alpha [Ornithinimicrobium sp. F0845]|uniref:exodeoxyribonuclease V subunit alpha n=1 Tax=Ornithinimicrobium sp. F0845 TaxID=2926412 RepID=UPI001FF21828|nr:exodeoxyribonuclease V subunit alpha [Ornithinimicrobium sp. F0845]MCK0112815.1 exodeoxyribonuclease V subunit alpha [Ornithinimicrobium sp. F0845]